MSRRVGVFRNFLNSFFRVKQKQKFVGTDQQGNKYFEREADKSHNLRGARWVEPADGDHQNALPEVPPEWDSWLRNKRFSPPTPEELEQNFIQKLKTQARVKELEEKEQLERYQEEKERRTVDANLDDFLRNVPRATEKREFPKYDDLETKPGSFIRHSR